MPQQATTTIINVSLGLISILCTILVPVFLLNKKHYLHEAAHPAVVSCSLNCTHTIMVDFDFSICLQGRKALTMCHLQRVERVTRQQARNDGSCDSRRLSEQCGPFAKWRVIHYGLPALPQRQTSSFSINFSNC